MSNLKVYAKTIEDEALEQINTLLSQDAFKDCKVRIMPDVHAGKGCVIGFTADLGNKVIPNIVGVDIGCGMLCVSLGHMDFNAVTLNTLDRVIRTYVPSGKNVHDGRKMRFEELKELYCYRELKDTKRLERSIGTLGGAVIANIHTNPVWDLSFDLIVKFSGKHIIVVVTYERFNCCTMEICL